MGEELYTISSGRILSYIELIGLLDTFNLDELHEFRYDPDNKHLQELLKDYYKKRIKDYIGL